MKNCLFSFTEQFKETLWGGHSILPFKGFQPDGRCIGESWELCGLPGQESVVTGGDSHGLTLMELVRQEGAALLGGAVSRRYGDRFPLLVKFIDAEQPLSVQVHPDDRLAQQRHGCSGKTEMWYVADCRPGAWLFDGFSREVTPEEYEARVAACTLPEVLRRCEVQRGDAFFLPAGRVHSIGPGCFICEIQQSSDVTYRIYDFGRLDADGQPRRLHVKEAREAVCFAPEGGGMQPQVRQGEWTPLVRCESFCTSVCRLQEPQECDYSRRDSFVILVCTAGACRVECGSESRQLAAGHTLLVAAAAQGVRIVPATDGAELLEVYINE